MMDVFYHCTTSLSQRSHFFVRPCVLSGGAAYPNSSIMSLSSISLMAMESCLSTCIFSYSARQDVQMPIFWPPPHKRPKMDYKHYIRTSQDNNYCIVKDHLYHLAIFIKAT
jgi:hypothetical protein